MKHTIITLFISLIAVFNLYAQDLSLNSQFDDSNKKINIKLNGSRNPGQRPGMPPFYQVVTCSYYDGYLDIEFAEWDGECYIYILLDNGGTYDMFFDSSEQVFTTYIGYPEMFRQVDIEVTTSKGNEYVGTLSFE